MRGRVFLASLLLWVLAVAAPSQTKTADESKAVGEIRAVLDRQVAAWNSHDLEGFMAGYWKSPELSFFSGGTKTASWQATLDRYRNRYQSAGTEMGRLDFSDIEVVTLGKDAAFVRGRWHLQMKDSEPGGLFTLIFRKQPEGWRIVHDHTSSQ